MGSEKTLRFLGGARAPPAFSRACGMVTSAALPGTRGANRGNERLPMRVVVASFVLASSLVASEAARAGQPRNVVATAGGAAITAEELSEAVGAKLCAVETDAYDRKVQVLYELIDKHLETQEAGRRRIPVDDLVKIEVEDKVPPVPDSDVNAAYERVKARFADKPEAELKKLIADDLKRQHQRERQEEFHRELRSKAGTRILFEPPRVSVNDGGDLAKGPKDAPVTVLEFSDFQCPYCGRVEPALKRIEESYRDKIRLVFRNYPLPMHPLAPKAAEAAACAADQGKFWDMHDHIFAHQNKLEIADLKASAVEIGLDPQAFGECLDSGRHEADWRSDQKAGDAYGVQATPWFFI